MPAPLDLRRRLSSVIKRFRFEELELAVVPNFPETSWNRIRSRLVKHHQSFTVSNALRIIEETINEANISDRVLKDRVAELELIEVSRHHKKKIWYTFTLKGEGDLHLPGVNELQARIVQNFRIRQMEMDIRIIIHEDITYISMRDKPRAKETRRMLPVYFALFDEPEHVFCSKKNVTKECIHILTESLGYSGAKKNKLMGRDLHSLLKMLWMKKQGAVDSKDMVESPKLEDSQPIITSTGIDFRQNKQRREYVERCFGEKPPTLESLVAVGPEVTWKDEEISLRIPEEKIQISWEFRSPNIAGTLTKLAENRVFAMPLPQYVSSLMKFGKNELKLSEQ